MQQKLVEKAYFIFKLTGRTKVRPASSDKWKAPLEYHLPPPPPSTPGYTYSSPHVRESGFQNRWKFCLQNLESWALESGIQLKDLESH